MPSNLDLEPKPQVPADVEAHQQLMAEAKSPEDVAFLMSEERRIDEERKQALEEVGQLALQNEIQRQEEHVRQIEDIEKGGDREHPYGNTGRRA